MTRTSTMTLLMVGAFSVLLAVVVAAFVDFDRQGVRGVLVGTGVGLLNLVVGYAVAKRVLKRNLKSAMTMVGGGFILRLAVVAVLTIVFQRTGAADPAAFALTFLVFFFVYLGAEILLVEKSLAEARKIKDEEAIDDEKAEKPAAEPSPA